MKRKFEKKNRHCHLRDADDSEMNRPEVGQQTSCPAENIKGSLLKQWLRRIISTYGHCLFGIMILK